jgi:hypothetical protein
MASSSDDSKANELRRWKTDPAVPENLGGRLTSSSDDSKVNELRRWNTDPAVPENLAGGPIASADLEPNESWRWKTAPGV